LSFFATKSYSQTDTSFNKYRFHAGWYDFTEDTIFLKNDSFLLKYKNLLGYSNNESFELADSVTDDLGFKHETSNIFHKGFPIIDFQIIVHSYSGYVTVVNGNIPYNMDANDEATYSINTTRQIAIDSCYGSSFAWEDPNWQDSLKVYFDDSTISFYPEGQLVFHEITSQENSPEYKLCYLFTINELAPLHETFNLLIDANTGSLILRLKNNRTCNSHNGSVTTNFDGNQTIEVASRFGNYRLEDCGRKIEARWADFTSGNTLKAWWRLNNVTDNNGSWGTGDQLATTPYWGMQKSYDYFGANHNIKAFGNKICMTVNLPGDATGYKPEDSKKLKASQFIIGKTTSNIALATLDIVGHEYMHSVVHRISELGGSVTNFGETGALEESLGDIFGILISNYFKGNAVIEWGLGKDLFGSPGNRNLKTGLSSNLDQPLQPLFMSDTRFKPSGVNDADLGGIHTNCGVISKWFQLLTEGGTQQGITVYGIGKDAAEAIVYRAVDFFTNRKTNFVDFKIATLKSLQDLYGHCSFNFRMTIRAWNAVEVFGGSQGNDGLNCARITGPPMLCRDELPKTVNYKIAACIGGVTSPLSVLWSPPSTWTNNGITSDLITFTNQSPYSSNALSAIVSLTGSSTQLNAKIRILIDQTNTTCKTFKGYRDDYLGKRSLTNNSEQNEIFNIFPNPTQNLITFNFQSEKNLPIKIKIYDAVGKEIYSSTFINNSGKIETETFKDGIYNFTAEIGTTYISKKLLILN
jgi:Zn-dependent metalloprotease